MKVDDLKQGFGSLWDSMTEGWSRLRESAAGALTRFRPSEQANLPERDRIDDEFYRPSQRWAMLGGDVFEDEGRIVVRLEVPGMAKDDFTVEVQDDRLVVGGEKRFERESTDGRWRVLQCAYGSFRREVPLPVAVKSEEAQARYENGVLRIELPKAAPSAPKGVSIKVS